MQKGGMAFKTLVFCTTAAAVLFLTNPISKPPLAEHLFGRGENTSQRRYVASESSSARHVGARGRLSLPNQDSISSISDSAQTDSTISFELGRLRKVELSDLDAKIVVLLEHHKNASNRLAFAQLMNKTPNSVFFSEFFEPEWQDSVNAYLRQPSDTLSEWLNQKTYCMSYDFGPDPDSNLASSGNHSYGKLIFAAKKSGRNLYGFYASYHGINTERTVRPLDGLYAQQLVKHKIPKDSTSFILVGGWHFGLKEKLKKSGRDAVNVLLWDPKLGPIRTTQIGREDFKVRFNNEVDKPLIGLNLRPGLYALESGSNYASRYGIDYILVVDIHLDLPMPPVRGD